MPVWETRSADGPWNLVEDGAVVASVTKGDGEYLAQSGAFPVNHAERLDEAKLLCERLRSEPVPSDA